MATLRDNRKYQAMTVTEADELLMRMGRAKAIMERAEAQWKKRIADMMLKQKEELDPLIAKFREAEAELDAYVSANQNRFIKPRMHKVPNVGEYGIRTVAAYVDLEGKGKPLIEYAMANGLSDTLLAMKPSPDKDKIAEAISGGMDVPYAKLIPAGDKLNYKFVPGYLESALKG